MGKPIILWIQAEAVVHLKSTYALNGDEILIYPQEGLNYRNLSVKT